jgi:YtcA family
MHRNAASSSLARSLIVLVSLSLGGCSTSSAPSFDLFGAFFPAWLLCGIVGIAGAVAARVAFVSSHVTNTLPYQLAVCVAIGVITAVLFWLIGFGR